VNDKIDIIKHSIEETKDLYETACRGEYKSIYYPIVKAIEELNGGESIQIGSLSKEQFKHLLGSTSRKFHKQLRSKHLEGTNWLIIKK